MYLYLLIIIVLSIIGILYFNQGKKEHYVNRYAGRNQCGELDAGPMDRPKVKPSCFAYKIGPENERIYNALDKVSKGLDKELSRSNNLDNVFYEMALSNNNKINDLINGSTVRGVRDNLGAGSSLLDASKRTNLIDPKLLEVYNINENDTENLIRTAIEQHIASVLDLAMEKSGINFNDVVSKAITEDVKNRVVSPIISLSLTEVNRNVNRDIVSIINEIIQKADVDKQINDLVDIAINNDKRIQAYLDAGRSNQLRLGDFVYFRHRLDKPVEAICADGPAYQDIIVGGRVCDIDMVNKTASISYNIVINPNKNPRCQGLAATSPAVINYDRGAEGIPKWYPMSNDGKDNCGFGLPDKLACSPSMWNDSNDTWVSEWIGGFDRKSNKMACGVSPKNYSLPEKVPISSLNKNLDKLLLACQQELDIISPRQEPPMNTISAAPPVALPPLAQQQKQAQKKCPDRCLSFVEDNNKTNRTITLSNGNKYYIKNDMLFKNDNGIPMTKGIVPKFVFKRNDQNTIFIMGSDNKYYKLTSRGILEMDDIDLNELGGNPDNSGCCFKTT